MRIRLSKSWAKKWKEQRQQGKEPREILASQLRSLKSRGPSPATSAYKGYGGLVRRFATQKRQKPIKIPKPVSFMRARAGLLAKYRGQIVERREFAQARDNAARQHMHDWGSGQDNRYFGRHADKWDNSNQWRKKKRGRLWD